MGIGGGGLPDVGLKVLLEALDEGVKLEWIDVDDIADDEWTACVYGMGSTAPISDETKAEIKKLGLKPVMAGKEMEAALKELADYTDITLSAMVSPELGGSNTPEPLVAAARMGLAVVDADFAGKAAPEEMQGRSLVPWLRAGPEAIAAEADREHLAEIVYGDAYWARSLRTGRWKTILSRLGEDVRVQLYDLETDPGETNDLAPELPDRAATMVERIEQLAAAAAAGSEPGATAEFDPVTQERLRALGYVE